MQLKHIPSQTDPNPPKYKEAPPKSLFEFTRDISSIYDTESTKAVSTGFAMDDINDIIDEEEIESSLLSFINSSVSTSGDLKAKNTSIGQAIIKLMGEYGDPVIQQYEYNKYSRPQMRIDLRPYHQNNPVDTIRVNMGSIPDLIEELSHVKQYATDPLSRVAIAKRNISENLELGDKPRYSTPGTVEYQAHREIEPIIKKRFVTLMDSLYAPILVESLFQNQQ